MNPWDQFLADIGGATQVFLVGPLLRGVYTASGPTIYVDGGLKARFGVSEETFPAVSVGDGDSYDGPLDKTLPTDKNFSDLKFALGSLPASVRHVELLGFLGGRLDHQLINYGEVHSFLKTRRVFTTVRFEDQVVAFCGGGFQLDVHGRFSAVVFEPSAVTIAGACKYTSPRPFHLDTVSSVGLSNEGFGKVGFDSVGPCFLFFG